tara:strand:+ start:131 stop:589 length:459 start_codon:yes stop_codon:yes gene_type:complete
MSNWMIILKNDTFTIWEYWFKGKEGNSIIANLPYSGLLPDENGQIEYTKNFWNENHEKFKAAIGDKFVGVNPDTYAEIKEPFSLTLTGVEIIDTSEKGFSFGYDKHFQEIKEPDEVRLDNWLKVEYSYNILIDLDESVLLDRIQEDDFTAKF